jgi:murein DD-endopeptidase MepM/ murein hydrolase activator NlpD
MVHSARRFMTFPLVPRRALPIAMLAILAASCATESAPGSGVSRRDIDLARDPNVIDAVVPRDATLESLLRQHDVSGDLALALIGSIRTVFNPRELRANQAYRISRTLDGLITEFRYQIDADRLLRAVRMNPAAGAAAAAFEVAVVPLPKELVVDAVAASISREVPSLVGSFDALGESVPLALSLAEIFGGVIDFNSDLQPGDRLEVLFDRAVRYGESAGYGEIRAAVLIASGRRHVAIRHVNPDGKAGYYDEEGRSLRRQFLSSPLPFDPRVTSRFSYRRMHPVHGRVRPHLGVDYGAAVGTSVLAVADGVVEFAGWNGEAGRMIRLRHTAGYQTLYLHLSSLAPGIRPGARVSQRQLIGRVGMTGSATGPHLDYRIVKNGVYVNPLLERQRMPPGDPIAASRLPAFTDLRDEVMADLRMRLTAQAARLPAARSGVSN